MISNFQQNHQDFSYEIGAGTKSLTISNIHLEASEFETYMNLATT